MLFNSYAFVVFLPAVLLVYYALSTRWQNRWLLVASYVFYGWWDWRFTTLLFISTVLDFNCALQIERRPGKARLFLLASLCGNLGILGTFKYFDFFADSAVRLLNLFHANPDMPTLRLVLPVGISFYTLQSLAYTIDVYRRKLKPTPVFVDFALYVSFFPQLVAGPIERAPRLLPQLQTRRVVTQRHVTSGLLLILTGYLKKVGIADAVAPLVEQAFSDPQLASSYDLLLSAYLFSLQIYCDFSGYSDIARGVGKLLGVELMKNFNQPYLSTSITEFWRRWHVSLSTWLRDYLYIPLGGNRHGRVNTYRNLMITMGLGGLWHGANWTFVVWGLLHGLYLAIHKLMLGGRKAATSHRFAGRGDYLRFALKCLVTFHLVTLTWIFFRSADFSHAVAYLNGLLHWQGSLPKMLLVQCGWYVLLVLFIDVAQYQRDSHLAVLSWHWMGRAAFYVVSFFAILCGGFGADAPFIYFQF